ncbi:MAG: hypothetical protein FD175_522 [Beijerinckiaceae bacterium]|nr:MAG: hypothetical protein FD175_522 [Beijerinckiaceae bacterium]
MSINAERIALAGEYVLGLLDPAERERVDERAATDAALVTAICDWQRHFSAIDAAAVPMVPSPGLWDRIDASIGDSAQQSRRKAGGGLGTALSRFWNSFAIWRPLGMAGAFASLVFAVLLAIRIAGGPEVPQLVAVLTAPDGRAAAVVNAYADGTVQLVPLDAIAVPEGRVLEVWTLQTRERGPVSLARMDKARTIRLDLKGLSAAEVGHLFEITLEPDGGSPTGRPTGPVLMKGLAATRL